MIPRVLTIAGSDSGGGAGIQADLKTIGVLGGYGMTAITALTAQNTLGVSGVLTIEASFVRKQIDAVVADIGVDAVKTGMLANREIILEVVRFAAEHGELPFVVDPVLVAESGAGLLEPEAESILLEELVPLATIVTPNSQEAARLLEMSVDDRATQREAARRLVDRGARAALVKGGHLPGADAVDVLCYEGEIEEISGPRIAAANTHGTGCIMASAIAVHLASGSDLLASVIAAKKFVSRAIAGGLALGAGAGPANPFAR